jgi:hypothetical protein
MNLLETRRIFSGTEFLSHIANFLIDLKMYESILPVTLHRVLDEMRILNGNIS